jgi:hypothetical protein
MILSLWFNPYDSISMTILITYNLIPITESLWQSLWINPYDNSYDWILLAIAISIKMTWKNRYGNPFDPILMTEFLCINHYHWIPYGKDPHGKFCTCLAKGYSVCLSAHQFVHPSVHQNNRTTSIRHQWMKAIVLSWHRCLINTGVEQIINF